MVTPTIQLHRYWTLRLKSVKYNQAHSLEKYVHEGHISETLHNATLSQQEIINHLKQSTLILQEWQCLHHTLRESYLKSLADATVVHNNPSLLQPDLTLKRSE
jgi:hypothetical protein